MSLVRTAARQLADFTERHASPGAKPWAAAIAAELDAIEGDWRALGWAIGGLRVLARYRSAPIESMDQLASEAERYAARRRGQGGTWLGRLTGWLFLATALPANLPSILHHRDALGRSLLLTAWLGNGLLAVLRSREPEIPDADASQAVILFYREHLRRTLRLYPFECVTTPFYLAYFVYEAQRIAWFEWILIAACIVGFVFALQQYANLRSKLAQVEALLDSREA